MPACIRAINACAEKIGIPRIVDDIIIDDKTIDALAEIHLQLGMSNKIYNDAEHNEFGTALELYRQYIPDEKSDDSALRDHMGTKYWDFIKNGGKETSRNEVAAYLEILLDKRNNFSDSRKEIVKEAIEGLQGKILSIDSKQRSTSHDTSRSKMRLFSHSIKTKDGSDERNTNQLGGLKKDNKKH